MSATCPHCGHAPASDPAHDAAGADCPRCGAPAMSAATETAAPTAARDGAGPPAALAPSVPRPNRPAPRPTPSFVRIPAATAANARMSWRWHLAVALLLVALVLQALLAQRHELAADARWRPALGALCTLLRCSLPPWREPDAFAMLERSVQPRADRPGALAVRASFRNDARWPQPWPTLVLSLSDVDGRLVGMRAFAPHEYRRGHRPGDLLAPGQSAAVAFDVAEPAPRIVAFTFDFR
ncbi:uncharacterized protein DUF3426 [Vulcaniibacterium tengchongense]|uniref:Uncharacterized protein DUF3426 n=2 Tax=Vulcaniibacterium tengchongense TaxID=1273429 RepID=A0A3N4VRW8_9GAMM|nr:uncharacterized protein DUF3426 [Vulcaniibacterium tengchongense]